MRTTEPRSEMVSYRATPEEKEALAAQAQAAKRSIASHIAWLVEQEDERIREVRRAKRAKG